MTRIEFEDTVNSWWKLAELLDYDKSAMSNLGGYTLMPWEEAYDDISETLEEIVSEEGWLYAKEWLDNLWEEEWYLKVNDAYGDYIPADISQFQIMKMLILTNPGAFGIVFEDEVETSTDECEWCESIDEEEEAFVWI